MKLPVIPDPTPYRSPPFYIEDCQAKVLQTSAQTYLDEIKVLVREIKKYNQCLRLKGYVLEGVTFDKISATKETKIE